MIQLSKEPPPIWHMMVREYGMKPWRECPDLVVAYDGVIYTHRPIPPDVVHHELEHLEQQKRFPGGPEVFMRRYMREPDFMVECEIGAYRAQLRYIRSTKPSRNELDAAHRRLAALLSGPLYKNSISYGSALAQIGSPHLTPRQPENGV